MSSVAQALSCRSTHCPGEAVTCPDDFKTVGSPTVTECPGAGRGQRWRALGVQGSEQDDSVKGDIIMLWQPMETVILTGEPECMVNSKNEGQENILEVDRFSQYIRIVSVQVLLCPLLVMEPRTYYSTSLNFQFPGLHHWKFREHLP